MLLQEPEFCLDSALSENEKNAVRTPSATKELFPLQLLGLSGLEVKWIRCCSSSFTRGMARERRVSRIKDPTPRPLL